ncbi:hypothetical protein SAMN04488100_11446 [Alkalibacterium putridalgicola]|uniref:Uncharacterized protein n=1 Tax=Alkalibacterium putridalgicola TaxID=426703 RepID=A0A1H7TWV5_9LACT|nr:DUF6442 family protein [Alkalibacterium putridalgicola]GEK88588.1 hypothetical protein APU01nite_06270 [Alkalibacterium putridalgicola]SEL88948.1 hypothetical protein SAMN04488100_11446 [Alkalibacterium putridalgicola]
MDKETIVEKAQKSGKDEREMQIRNKSYKFSWILVSITLLALAGFRVFQNETVTDLFLILITHNFGLMLYQYYQKRELTKLTFGTLLSLFALGLGVFALLSQYGVF